MSDILTPLAWVPYSESTIDSGILGTVVDWADICGLVTVYHGPHGSWLVTDRRALGRSADCRYRWQVLSGDQSHAYGLRSERAARLLAEYASQAGIDRALDYITTTNHDIARYPVIAGHPAPITLGGDA